MIVVIVTLLFAQALWGQTVMKVRFIDSTSSRPLHVYVSVDAWQGDWVNGKITPQTAVVSEPYKKGHDGEITVKLPELQNGKRIAVFTAAARTDGNGNLLIHLVGPLPEKIRLSSFQLAKAPPSFEVEDILRSGKTWFAYSAAGPISRQTALQGNIVIVDRMVTASDRIRQEFP